MTVRHWYQSVCQTQTRLPCRQLNVQRQYFSVKTTRHLNFKLNTKGIYMENMDEEEIFAEEDPVSISVTQFFELYGWYVLILAIIIYSIYNKYKRQLDIYWKKKEEDLFSAKYHKDPDVIAARLAAQQEYAMKLQEKYKRDAEEYKQKMEEKEARKRNEWLEKNGGPSGKKLGFSSKPEYNPLSGDTSRGYRPQKKSPCGGGGCGK